MPKNLFERRLTFFLSAIGLMLGLASPVPSQTPPRRTEANRWMEIRLTAAHEHADPFNEVTLDLEIKTPSGKELRVPGFWAGDQAWRVRYASPEIGIHQFKTVCSDLSDHGLHQVSGQIEVTPYQGGNSLYQHGPLRISKGNRHLEHLDHTPFLWLGDTWWMGLAKRLEWPAEFKELTADRKAKGFNVIQIVAGLYPDMPAFDPRGANEAGFPWDKDYGRINPAYFDAADQRLEHLVEQGLTPCIVGAWGYFIPWTGLDRMKAHWRYLIARYGAMPVVWCAAGEANLPWYLTPGFPFEDAKQVHDWTLILRYIRETDPFHRPLTIHPTAVHHYSSRYATEDPALLDFDFLQTPHGRQEAVPRTVGAVNQAYEATPRLPVIDGEASYEMLSDSLPTEWTRRMFWLCLMNGAAGHTYGANGIWQNNRPGDPHGLSPTGGTYGKITWREAMNLPGSTQVGLGKRLLEQYDWTQFQPHPSWAVFADATNRLNLDAASWIWFPEGNAAADAPTEKRWFRRQVNLPANKIIKLARVRIAADDAFTGYVNGTVFGRGEDWHNPVFVRDLAKLLSPGTNIFAIEAENKAAEVAANPAGLILTVEVEFLDGSRLQFGSDSSWRCSKTNAPGWEATDFEDSKWVLAKTLGRHGIRPWGRITPFDTPAFGPQSTGTQEGVRIVYVPEPRPIYLQQLVKGSQLTAYYFDPLNGARSRIESVRPDDSDRWLCAPPKGVTTDWVVVLEPSGH